VAYGVEVFSSSGRKMWQQQDLAFRYFGEVILPVQQPAGTYVVPIPEGTGMFCMFYQRRWIVDPGFWHEGLIIWNFNEVYSVDNIIHFSANIYNNAISTPGAPADPRPEGVVCKIYVFGV